MKRVLFITYYWPPSGKASLHWPLAVIRHLPNFDWDPVVLTVENESFTEKDYSLLNEINPALKVYKTKAAEVFNLYKMFIGKKKDESLSVSETMSKDKGFRQRISLWIRMNLFVPDARVLWYPSAVKSGKKLLELLKTNSEPIDVIISIGTPHSTHLIGKKLSRIFNIPHIPLFTDPWTSISYYKKFNRNFLARAIDNRFEKKVIENSTAVIFVTNNTRSEYISKYPTLRNKSFVLYWGYNEENFTQFPESKQHPGNEKVLLHTGNLFDYQNPVNLWNTVRNRINNGENLRIRFTGTVGPAIIPSLWNAILFFPPNDALLPRPK